MPEPDVTKNDPSVQSAAVIDMGRHWPLISALMGGTSAMRDAGETYLPRWPAEECDSYECRRKSAVLFPAYSRTVVVLTGKPFSKPITIGDDVPPAVRELLDDVDREGRNLDAFAAAVFADALTYGISGILVDYPPSKGARTVKDERDAKLRPYLVHVRHDAILGWKTERRDGETKLSQLRLLEKVEVDDGPYRTKVVDQVRVLTPGRWEIHRKVKDDAGREAWAVIDEGDTTVGGERLKDIPFAPVYGYRVDYMVGRPPMLDLAYLNVKHWQSSSDQQTILHAARVPILVVTGADDKEDVVIGVGTAIKLQNPAAKVAWCEHTGAAIEAGRVSLLDDEDRMRQTGAELLVIKPGNTTVVQTRSDNEPAMCDLQRITLATQDGFNLALYYLARFLRLDKGGHVSVYSDFGVSNLSEASAQLVVDLEGAGMLTKSTTLHEMQRRGHLSADVDVAEEIKAAEAEKQAAVKAAQQAMAKAKADAQTTDAAKAEADGGATGAEALTPTPVG
jgi:hypothetical protein